MSGIRITVGCDLQIGSLTIDTSGNVPPSATLKLRTDMWPFWLRDAVEAAVAAKSYAESIPDAKAGGDEDKLTFAMTEELRATMRAISGSAFAIDGFYAAVKARTSPHPDQALWIKNKTSRASQISTTLAYHLKLKNSASKGLSERLKSIFRFRDYAVHLDSQYHEAIHRPDIDAGVDRHFILFRAENAINATFGAVNTLDQLTSVLHKGGAELTEYKKVAREAMNDVLDLYETTTLTKIDRAEPPD